MYPRLASIYQVVEGDLELLILQSLLLECWDFSLLLFTVPSFMECWRWNRELHAKEARTLPNKPHPSHFCSY